MMDEVTIGKARILHGDCLTFMRELPDKFYELAIVDPPYGIDINNSGTWMKAHDLKKWDNAIPDKFYFNELKRISVHQIIWGGNYFTDNLTPNNNWIIWHKMNDGMSFSMCEMAYSTIRKNIKLFTLMNNGVNKTHPTQKPTALYEWLLSNYAKAGDKIFDSHMGSGSCAIACNNLGFESTNCELDVDYFNAACARIKQATSQQRLFEPEIKQAVQTNILL